MAAIQKIETPTYADISERHLELVVDNTQRADEAFGVDLAPNIDSLPADAETNRRRLLLATGLGVVAIEATHAFIEGFSRRGSSTEGIVHVAGHFLHKGWEKISLL